MHKGIQVLLAVCAIFLIVAAFLVSAAVIQSPRTDAAQVEKRGAPAVAQATATAATAPPVRQVVAPKVGVPSVKTDGACMDIAVPNNGVQKIEANCNYVVKGDVQVGPSKDGPWTVWYDEDGSTGLLLVCTENCWIKATWGANVSPRTIDDLRNEMLQTGCEGQKGCREVVVKYYPHEQQPTPVGAPAPTATVAEIPACNFSIPRGQILQVPAGCTVSGDVSIGPNQNGPWTALYRGIQDEGNVVKMEANGYVLAVYGASVSSSSPEAVADTLKNVGCGLPTGCRVVKMWRWNGTSATGAASK